MGPQPSALNCKVNETDKISQVTATKQFAIKNNKGYSQDQQPTIYDNKIPTQNFIGVKSPRNQLTRATSEKNISSKSSRQTVKPKRFIPEHQAITKVSETPFRQSIKQKNMFVQQKTKNLGEIVESRYNTPKHLPYSQILSLTQTLVYGLAYMSKKNCNHHDFYPTNIYYNQGKFKVINPIQLQVSGFYLTKQRQRFSFLSPQLIIAILQEKTQAQIGEQMMTKSDVFAIGMILLQTCSLQPSSQCYDQQSYNIVDSIIKERIAKTAKVYTSGMAQCINIMLQYEVQQRINAQMLAQLVHSRIQNQRQISMQLQAPKMQGSPQGNPQNPQNIPVNRGMPPPHMMQPPPHMIQRGPPPPPYNKQPFKLQNLNENVIAVSMPNQVYTRISPNNQGFLSSSSLQQKLRVIELIRQNPNEQDSEGQHDGKTNQVQKPHQVKQPQISSQQRRNIPVQNEHIRPQYPQKPLMVQQVNQYERKQVEISTPVIASEPNHNPHMLQTNQHQGYKRYTQQQNKPTNIYQTSNTYQIPSQQQYKVKSFVPGQKLSTIGSLQSNQQQMNNFTNKQAYGMPSSLSSPKSSPLISNTFTSQQTQQINQDLNKNYGSIPSSSFSNQNSAGFTNKYGTSFQNNNTNKLQESLQQRVQRVLNMSRNAK